MDNSAVTTSLAIPRERSDDESGLWAWYRNIPVELESRFLTAEQAAKMRDYYLEAGLLRPWRANFFRRHYCESFARASAFLLAGHERPHILDLGCGTGSQSIYLALLGAKVTGIDMDTEALEILRRRKALYEELSGQSLDIDLIDRNTFDIDYAELTPIDGVYSMFAFNMMQPSARLMDAMAAGFSADARLAIIDGNNESWLPRLISSRRRNVWSPAVFAEYLRSHGFRVIEHEGAVSLPPAFWAASLPLVKPLDTMLNRNWLFALSHQILAERRP
jgi:SAM-dependent methyltransferase